MHVVCDFIGPAKFVEWVKGKLQICKINLDKKVVEIKNIENYFDFLTSVTSLIFDVR